MEEFERALCHDAVVRLNSRFDQLVSPLDGIGKSVTLDTNKNIQATWFIAVRCRDIAMTRRNILLLIVGLGISLVFSGVIYYYLFLETIDLFGIDEIKNPEGRHGKILLTALSTSSLTLLIAVLLRKERYAAIGFAVPSLIGIILMVVVGPTYVNKSNYYEPFDRQKWLLMKYESVGS